MRKAYPIHRTEGKGRKNVFTPFDYAIAREAVKNLPGPLGSVTEMRFWQLMALDEIAVALGLPVTSIEAALREATKIIREECLRHPAFSRSKLQTQRVTDVQGVASRPPI